MPAIIQKSEIRWGAPVSINFGFSGINEEHALMLMRRIITDQWPDLARGSQCIYVIRLSGEFAVRYPHKFNPTIYIGEGNARGRLITHVNWIVPLVRSVTQIGIEVRVAEIVRRNNVKLRRNIEADMLRWFQDGHGALPWFNRQRERSREECFDYEIEAKRSLVGGFSVGSGNNFKWAIEPTKNNPFYESFSTGHHD